MTKRFILYRLGGTALLGLILLVAAACGRNDGTLALNAVEGGGAAEELQAQVLKDLHKSNQKEIQVGQLVQERSDNDQIKQFAQTIVQDHQDADKRVTELAEKLGVDLIQPAGAQPAEGGDVGGAVVDPDVEALRGLEGQELNRRFLEMMVSDHETEIAKLEQSQKDLQEGEVKQLVTDLLPTLQGHLEQARKLLQSLGGEAPTDGDTTPGGGETGDTGGKEQGKTGKGEPPVSSPPVQQQIPVKQGK